MAQHGLDAPRPMEGHGAYNRSSSVQAAGLLPAVALLEAAAAELRLPSPPQALVVADYGAATGHNSLLPLSAALAALRRRIGRERPVWVVHTDLPDNDFSSLFATLEHDPERYALDDPMVYWSAVGRSFYEQILPSASVALGWSSWAVQWLSRVPALIPDHVQVADSRDEGTRGAFARQAGEDWLAFLAARSRELVPDGRLVVVTMATADDGAFGYRPLLAAIESGLKALVGDGTVSADEVLRMVIPTVGRSRADFSRPFAGSGGYEGLALDGLDIYEAEDRIFAGYRTDGDAAAFGARWSAFSRASVFPTLAAALGGADSAARSLRFMDRLEAEVAARLATAPEAMRIPLARMTIRKVA